MRPQITLDSAIVARNFSAWRALAGVPVRPVIKCNGYNWGYARMIEILDPLCEAYCVADLDELLAAREFTNHPIVILGAIPPESFDAALDAGAIANVQSAQDLAAVNAWSARNARAPVIRIGIRPAIGWSGLDLAAIEELAPLLAASRLRLEVWTHITSPGDAAGLRDRLAQAVQTLRTHGAVVEATDVASTYPLASGGAMGDTVRVGIGLFGATGGPAVKGVRCALRIVAPVVSANRVAAGTKVGYGERKIGQDGKVLTVRCGYGDGLPKGLASASDTLSVGMQYTTIRVADEALERSALALLDHDTDLDAFAAAAASSAHEIVTALGMHATRRTFLFEE
jgi:alanine racemase